jgi:predicted AAA+ superfamily ATPase
MLAEALAAAMATSPVVAITGPRTVGKSTLAIEVTAVDQLWRGAAG